MMRKAILIFIPAMLLMAQTFPDAAELRRMSSRFAPAELKVDTSKLSSGDRKALAKLIEAARLVDRIFLVQFWSGNPGMYERLKKDTSELGRERLAYFWLNKGPWSALDHHKAFLPGAPPEKLAGSNFYPEDMKKEEFEAWLKTLDEADRKRATGFFTVIRRDEGKLKQIPYSVEYRKDLERLSALLKEAADLTANQTLKRYLNSRANAFLSNPKFFGLF